MILTSGSPIWINQHAISVQYPYLDSREECEIAIIGGGVIGCICAYFLNDAGINTIIIDKNIIGYGSTSACTAILDYQIDVDITRLKNLIGLKNAVKSYQLCLESISTLESILKSIGNTCDFSRRDLFYYSVHPKDSPDLYEEYKIRTENEFKVDFLDRVEAKKRFTFDVASGIYSPEMGGEVDPYLLCHAIVKDRIKKGLRVYENTEAIEIEKSGDKIAIRTNKGKEITCKKVLVATGYEASKSVKISGLSLTTSFNIVSAPLNNLTPWYNRSLLRSNDTPYLYCRTTMDNRIIIGGEDIPASGVTGNLYKCLNGTALYEKKYDALIDKMRVMFPELKDIAIEYKFAGLFGGTKDGNPYIGIHKDYEDFYFCLSYGSNGILFGIIGAQMIRDSYIGKTPDHTPLYSFTR